MSDALLERLAKAAEGILAQMTKSPSGGAARPPAPAGSAGGAAPDAAAKAAAAKVAAAKKADDDKKKAAAVAAAKAKGGPAAGTKGPGGKHTVEQVRDIVRQVATNASLGKQSASDILDQDGGGVTKVTDLKPENYDKVFEACQVLLSGEGEGGTAEAPAEEDELM